jgi:hypothetical protein
VGGAELAGGGQGQHSRAHRRWNLPASQTGHTVDRPYSGVEVPSGQGVHADWAVASAYVPASQGSQEVCASSSPYVPASQGSQEVCASSLPYVPMGHAAQVEAAEA